MYSRYPDPDEFRQKLTDLFSERFGDGCRVVAICVYDDKVAGREMLRGYSNQDVPMTLSMLASFFEELDVERN